MITQQMIQQNLTAIMTDKAVNEDAAKIPFALSYVDPISNKLVVGIDRDSPLPMKVYEQKIRNLVGDVPVEIVSGKFIREVCTSQTSVCIPRVGGIKVTSTSGTTPVGTMTYVTSVS